jgi:hypothetical protein
MHVSKLFVVSAFFALAITGCRKEEFDMPPKKEIPEGQLITLAQLRSKFQGTAFKFEQDSTIYATVTMDDKSGNIYKNAYIQDGTGAINIRLLNSGGLYQGDSIRLNLKGTTLSSYNGMLQIDSVDVDRNIVKQKTRVDVEPRKITIDELLNGGMQAMLVKVENVQFKDEELGLTYANAITQQSQNRSIRDCYGTEVIVRSSGYASFAGEKVKEGRGSITAIVGEFNGTIQLYIRTTAEVDFKEERCGIIQPTIIFKEDFTDQLANQNISVNGWISALEEGTLNWRGRMNTNGDNTYAEMYIFGNSNTDASNKAWMVSPTINLSGNAKKFLSFETQVSYFTHQALKVFISTDYNGMNLPIANWKEIPCKIAGSGDGSRWVPSGNIDLTSYNGNITLAFRYEGSKPSGLTSTYRVDNIKVFVK